MYTYVYVDTHNYTHVDTYTHKITISIDAETPVMSTVLNTIRIPMWIYGEEEFILKIVSFAAIKGGVGKTTLLYNFGEWLAAKGHSVLMIDGDHQSSLSQTYDYFQLEGTIANVFDRRTKERVEIVSIKENLDLILSSLHLEELQDDVATVSNKEMLFFMWFNDNINRMKKYEYILIDCHPDFGTVTKNYVVASDVIFSPIEPSKYGMSSRDSLNIRYERFQQSLIDPFTRESFVTAKRYFLSNKLRHNTNSSRVFKEVTSELEGVIAHIPHSEKFNKSVLEMKPLVEMKEDKEYNRTPSDRKFFEEVEEIFSVMKAKVDEG